jgi:pectinesterase
VFLRCKLTGDAEPWADPTSSTPAKVWKLPNAHLGRPWRAHASVAFIECEMGEHIKPEGWHDWGKVENQTTARFAEFGNTGPGAQPDKRAPWAKRLSAEEAARITLESVLAGNDGWNPNAALTKGGLLH